MAILLYTLIQLLLCAVYKVLKSLACLELGNGSCGDLDSLSGLRVLALTSCSLGGLEGTEAYKLNLASLSDNLAVTPLALKYATNDFDICIYLRTITL